jgi:hypothetical protein
LTSINLQIKILKNPFFNFNFLDVVRVRVFNATVNNISVILWWSVILVEETRVPGENHRPAASH